MSSREGDPGDGDQAEIDVTALLSDPAEQKENAHDEDPDAVSPPDVDEEPGPPDFDEPPPLPPSDAPPAGGPAAGPGQPLAATCSTRFTAIHNSGTRATSRIKLIVIHSTEGDTAEGAARWFANPASNGSAHLVVDDIECYRTLLDTQIPWGAPGANTNGFHIEHAGFAKWAPERWMSHDMTLQRGAFKAAVHAVKFGVPVKLLTASDLLHGQGGFVSHATCTVAFHTPGGHTDPGTSFPFTHYMQLVARFVNQIQSTPTP